MKFGKLYKSAQHDAWVDYYIDYKGLKKVLKLAYDSQGSTTAFHEELWNQISQASSSKGSGSMRHNNLRLYPVSQGQHASRRVQSSIV
eukprot:5712570-Pleurochrysis_carterae.AAC.3